MASFILFLPIDFNLCVCVYIYIIAIQIALKAMFSFISNTGFFVFFYTYHTICAHFLSHCIYLFFDILQCKNSTLIQIRYPLQIAKP